MKRLYVLFIVLLLIFVISGCGILQTNTPKPQPPTAPLPITPNSLTHTPPYVHYSSPDDLDIHLEFDYPDYWIFSEQNEYGFITISLGDPRFLVLPTPDPNGNHHPTPNDLPWVSIWIQSLQPDQTLESEIQIRRKICSESWWKIFIKDYEVIIDGIDAKVVECQVKDPEFNFSWMFVRRVLFVINNKMYEIFFEVSEDERNQEFEKGYEYFMNSLKIRN